MNAEQERADFEAFASKHGLCVTEGGDLYRSHVVAWMWKAWQARASLQSQDEDIFSPTSLTGLSKDELIRQLQWALDYWMPAIASEDTPDGNRSARDARLLMGMKQPTGREEENTPAYWEKVKALQSQDREDAERYRWVKRHAHPNRGFDEWCLPYVDYVDDNLDAAIDRARRIEGEGE